MSGDHELHELPSLSSNPHPQLRGGEIRPPYGIHEGAPFLNGDDYDEDEPPMSLPKSRRGSASTVGSSMLYTVDEERLVVKKLDLKLVLFVAFLYMLSFLDRSNIGNAKLAGMSTDLHLTSRQFEWLLRAFYITYIAFEWMTVLWKIYQPHIYLAVCVASWGAIASFQAIASSFWSMLVLRACLGVSEAAFVGIPFYLSFFYKPHELAFRTGIFISAAPLATSFAGSVAWATTNLSDRIPVAPWRILFLLEGFPSIIVAFFVWLYIPDSPSKVKYFTRRQRKVAALRLRSKRPLTPETEPETQPNRSNWEDIRRTLTDPKAYLTPTMMLCSNVAFSSLPVFLPTIIEEMGYSPTTSQALSAPPYFFTFFMVLITARLSDRYRIRSTFVMLHASLAASGYAAMAIAGFQGARPMIRYFGVYPAAMGFFSAITIIITWTLNNQESDFGKGTGLSMLNYIGQLGPLLGLQLYPDNDQPYYTFGMTVCAGFMALVALLALIARLVFIKQNRKRDAEESCESKEDEGLVSSRGGKSFRFMI